MTMLTMGCFPSHPCLQYGFIITANPADRIVFSTEGTGSSGWVATSVHPQTQQPLVAPSSTRRLHGLHGLL